MEGHGRSRKVKEGQGRSRKVNEGHGWSFPITGLTVWVRKVTGSGGGVACRIILSAPVPFLFLWTLDFNFLDLNL